MSFGKEAWRQRKNSRSGAEYSVIPFLKSQGVKRLDEVIITHAHEDHFGDLLAIAQKVQFLFFISLKEQLKPIFRFAKS